MKHMARILAAALAIMLWNTLAAYALEITPGKPGLCLATLSGEIRNGDVQKLKATRLEMPETWPNAEDGRWKTVCLNSRGGTYAEALRIAQHLLDNQIGTVVDEDMQCLSACALVFMFGTAYQTESNALTHRRLHVRGELGFHQPDLPLDPERTYTVDDVRAAFSVALDATLRFLALAARPRPDARTPFVQSDLQEAMLRHKGDAFFRIDTVDKAGRWGIELIGFAPPEFSERGFFYACQNMLTWPARLALDQVDYGQTGSGFALRKTDWTAGGLVRARYDLQFSGLQSYDCAATVAQHWSGRVLPMLCGYREETNSSAGPSDCDAPQELYNWSPIPPQAMFPAQTPLHILAEARAETDRPEEKPLPDPCIAEDKRAIVTNVNVFTSLRKSTSYDSEKIDELPLGTAWETDLSPTVNPDYPRHEACVQLCQLAGQSDPFDMGALRQCITDNWMWFPITGPSGQSGFASAKYLDY